MLKPSQEKLSRLMAPRDRLARPLHDLRLSVIDRCNFRCAYCMPEASVKAKHPFVPRDALLTGDELVRLVLAFSALGVTRIRLTGGEPLLRPGFSDLVRRMARVPGIEDLSMTTNGVLLPRLAVELRKAGLKRITVSLDSLDEGVFARMAGGRGSAARVLEGIEAAEAAGFPSLKINCVVQKGVNDQTVMDMVDHFRGSGHIVRLIEFLDVGASNDWRAGQVVPGHHWLKQINDRWPLRPLGKSRLGETAQRYAFEDGQGEIGLINSITQPFCRDCSRARVTADGMLHTCLFSASGVPLRPLLGECRDSRALEEFIRDIWSGRTDRYSETRGQVNRQHRGQEMYRMGG